MPLLALGMLGCVRQAPPPPPMAETTPVVISEEAAYAAANDVARYPLPEKISLDLLALVEGTEGLEWDEQGRLLVRTWTRSQFYEDPAYVEGHAFALYGETWLTTGTQVADVCRGLPEDEVDLRLQQLLGLPPDATYDAFLEVWVEPEALFRPCADPDVTTTSCPVAAPIAVGDDGSVWFDCADDAADPHAAWLCSSWVNRYSPSDPQRQYPWTALGYTYDWGQPDSPEGASEFVAPAATSVVFHALIPTADFCAE